MNVEAPALSIAALIQSLLEESSVAEKVEDRLSQIGLDTDWLSQVAQRYLATWKAFGEAQNSAKEPSTFDIACEEVCFMLSWLCANCYKLDDVVAVNAKTKSNVAREYLRNSQFAEVPMSLQVQITAGTVSRPATNYSPFPMRLPVSDANVLNQDVAAAYDGLVTLALASIPDLTAEMHRTSVLWRLSGLADGLAEGNSSAGILEKLIGRMTMSMPVAERTQLSKGGWVKDFVSDRNALTHLRATSDRGGFKDAALRYLDVEALDLHLKAASYLTAFEINQHMRHLPPEVAKRWTAAIDADFEWLA